MARFKRAYPGRPYIRQGPAPVTPPAVTIQSAAPRFRLRPRARAVLGNGATAGDGIAIKSPPVSTLSDNLHSVTENAALWNPAFNLGVPVFTTSGVSVTTSTVTAQYSRIQTGGTYNLTGGFLSHRLVNPGNQALVSLEIIMAELADTQFNNRLGFYLNNGSLSAIYQVSGTNHFAGTVAFSPANHVWFRIRENLGTTFWETSQNGLSWSAFFSIANQFRVTDMYVVGIDAGTYNVEATSTTVVVDDINIAGSVTPVQSRPKPFVFRSPLPMRARARLGNSGAAGDGFAGPQPAPVVAVVKRPGPFVARSPARARARVGNAASTGDGAGYPAIYPPSGATGIYGLPRPVTFPISFRPFVAPPQPYQRTAPQVRRPPLSRARVGNNMQPGDGVAVVIPAAPQRYRRPPVQIRRPAPTRGQSGPLAGAVGAGVASQIVTPSGTPQVSDSILEFRPLPRPSRAVWRGLAAPHAAAAVPVVSRPRPFVFRSPAPARARVGNNAQTGDGVTSPVVTPQGTPSSPAPRPVIQHLPPHRAKVGPGTYLATGRPGVQTPLGFQSQPAPRPVIVHVPPHRALLGPRGQAAGGVPSAVSTPLGSPSQPAPRPVIQHLPPHRARVGNNGQPGDGVASTNVTPQGSLGPPHPFVWRSPAPARARLGNNLLAGDGYASQVVTPSGSPSSPAPRPVIQHLPAHRAVWRGLASSNITLQGAAGPPRPFVWRSPLPARARLGNNLSCGDGYPSSISTPQGSPSQPPPRPVIQHLPPRRIVWRGLASAISTPRGSLAPPRKVPLFPPKITRARIGTGTVAGGVPSSIVTPAVQAFVTPYQRTAPQIKRPAPARALTGHGGCGSGVASRNITPPLGSPSSPAPRPVIQHLPAHRAVWRGNAAPPPVVTAYQRKPFVFRPPLPARARLGNNLQTGDGVASRNITLQGIAGPPRPFVWRSPATARARLGPRFRPQGGIASAIITPQGTAGAPKPFVWRSPLPARGKTGPRGTASGGYANRVITPLGSTGPPRAFIFRSPARARGRLGGNLQCGDGLASTNVTPQGTLAPPRKVPQFPPKTTRARVGTGTVAGGIASTAITLAAPAVSQVPVPAGVRVSWLRTGHVQFFPVAALPAPLPPQPTLPVVEYRSPPPRHAMWRGLASQNVIPAPPQPGPPQPTVPVLEFRPPPPKRALWRGLASRNITSPPPVLGPPPPTVPVVEYRPPPPRRALWRGRAVPPPPPLGTPQPTVPVAIGQSKIGRAWVGHGQVAGGVHGFVTPPVVLGPPQPTLPVVEFRPPPPPRGYFGPHRVIGLFNPPPPPPPTVLAPLTWTVAATVPLTVTVTPTTPLTITATPAAPITVDVTPSREHLPPPGQQVILAQPEVTLNSELPPPIGQPS